LCIITRFGHIAQLVEQGTENPCVPSSILGVATIFKAELDQSLIRLFYNLLSSLKREFSKRIMLLKLELVSFPLGQI
jgi:hypothetical protein